MTDRRFEAAEIGEQLGTEGIGKLVSNAEAYCTCEEQRIALTNDPHIVFRRAEAATLVDEEEQIVARLRLAPPPGDLRTRRRKAVYYGLVTIILTAAGFVFSLYSFDPFRVGLKGYLYCLGIAIVEPFLLDYILDPWKGQVPKKSLAAAACGAGLLSLVLLAAIRGDLLAEQTKSSTPVVVIDGTPVESSPTENNFYEKATPLLQLVMIFLAVAMELGAGFALHEVWRLTAEDKEDWAKLRKRLTEIRQRLGVLAFEIRGLQLEPQVFSALFWSNFYRAMLTQTVRSAMTKIVILLLALLFVIHGFATAQSATKIVVALDLTKSEMIRNPDDQTEFQKNVEAVGKLLAQIPSNSDITIIGITDRSFTQPYILLSAHLSSDSGYFGERLNAARGELVVAWKKRSEKLVPCFRPTDVVGALVLAAHILADPGTPSQKWLIIYSDMRNSTPDMNLELPIFASGFPTVKPPVIAHLADVQVWIFGADGERRRISSWQQLKEFWKTYFLRAGAILKDYSTLH